MNAAKNGGRYGRRTTHIKVCRNEKKNNGIIEWWSEARGKGKGRERKGREAFPTTTMNSLFGILLITYDLLACEENK